MFTPIKNLITYIQKNASSNSLFGGNSSSEVSVKMETENIKIEEINANMQIESEIPKEIDKKDIVIKNHDNITDNVAKEESTFEQNKDSCSDTKDTADSKSNTLKIESTEATENACDYEDDDDIEEQIESSIMLKTPVKVPTTNSSEILELKKASNARRSIVISHDFNRNHALTPTDDELEDFRHDPMEVLGTTSSPCSNQPVDDFRSVGSEEEALNRDFKSLDDLTTEDEAGDNKAENEQKPSIDSEDLDIGEEKDIETENEQHDLNDVEDEEDPFLELDHYKSRNVIVLDEVDLNASTASVETINTTDDPLAIACEEQEAFAADKTAALEELNLLNNSQTSQDEDTRTTTDEDLRWLKTDLDSNQPSCSNNNQLKDQNSKTTPEKEERNGEGSDSGLGSETSALHITATSIADTSQLNIDTATPTQTSPQLKITKDDETTISSANVLRITKSTPKEPPKPQRSNLKRRLDANDDAVESLDTLESAASLNERSSLNGSIQKKSKRSINFDTVQVYYFPRQQGFSCVPSAGGCTLGMGARHIAFKTLTLAEHAAELRRAHRMQLQEIHPRGSSSEDSEESEEDYLSEGSGSDLDGESNGFLQPVSPKQRRALLKGAGIRKIDPSEKADCRNIRNSREVCGCTCRDFCDPETCACSQSGIKCQVDRDMFPCGCSRDACGNTIGRVEFNPTRVRTHYIHTLMRLEMENRQQQNPYSSAVASAMQPTPSSYYQTHLQPQSNYSSGYASPAYNTASDIHQQTAASSYYHTQNPSTSNSLYGQQISLEMNHNGSANSTASHYGIDTLDSSMFGGPTTANSAYGELMSVGSYHYGNLQTQASTYSSYQTAPYLNANSNTTSHGPSNTYSSCAVPSIPPFGTATTTEATGVYHSVSTLPSLEITTAPSCSVNGTLSLENDASTSFISLSTPLASSSRLSQINDLLQHNRNATTALVAISENLDTADNKSGSSASLTQVNSNNLQTVNSSSVCSSKNIPPMEDAHKNCMTLTEQETPSKSAQIVANNDDYHNSEPLKHPETAALLIEKAEEPPSLIKPEFLPQTSLSEEDKEPSIMAVSETIETSTVEVAAGN